MELKNKIWKIGKTNGTKKGRRRYCKSKTTDNQRNKITDTIYSLLKHPPDLLKNMCSVFYWKEYVRGKQT